MRLSGLERTGRLHREGPGFVRAKVPSGRKRKRAKVYRLRTTKTCRRCNGLGLIDTGGTCPVCFGTGIGKFDGHKGRSH